MLIATAPLFVAPSDRQTAEFALESLARARYLTVRSFVALVAPRGDYRDDMLEDWIRAGLVYRGRVRTDAIAGSDIEYLALTTRGAREIEAATGRHVEGVSGTTLARESQKRAHDLAVGECVAAFAALADEKRLTLLGTELDARKIGTSVVTHGLTRAPERIALQPDAYVALETEAGPRAFLVETDMGSTALPRMAKKLAAYIFWQHERGPERAFAIRGLRILVLANSEARAKRLCDATFRVVGKRSGFLLFGVIDDVRVETRERVFGPVVRQLGDAIGHRVPLLSLSAPRHTH